MSKYRAKAHGEGVFGRRLTVLSAMGRLAGGGVIIWIFGSDVKIGKHSECLYTYPLRGHGGPHKG